MCMWFWGYPAIIFFELFAFFFNSFFSCDTMPRTGLWAQLLLQFYTKLFEILQVFLSWSEDVHVLLGLSSHHFLSTFFHFFNVFQVPISIKIYTLWVQLILQFPPIILKLYLLVLHGLKMCVWFWGYPPIICYQLFPLFDLIFSN